MSRGYFSFRSNTRSFRTENPILITLGCTTVLAGVIAVLTIVSKMFEYSFYTVFGKDIPWYLDLLGACVLNALNFPLWVICMIIRAAGVEVPLIP
jgi:hypothetical protein